MFDYKKEKGHIVVYLEGRIDIHKSNDFDILMDQLISKNPDCDIIVNFEKAEYMSSSGLKVLVSYTRILEGKKKKLKICNMNKNIKKIFEVIELYDMFNVYPNEEKAFES